MQRLTRVLILFGVAATGLSVAWWWLTYRDVVGYAYLSAPNAGLCLVGESTICKLARSICRGAHPLDILEYWSPSFWLGVAALSLSLITGASVPRRAET
ncbi:MAG: hypothetical protein ABSE69_10670 [Roseiarcus sp.]|jgi:hypothetical protein